MQALWETLLALLPPGAPEASSSPPWAHRPLWRGLGPEALEDRTVPSLSVLGVPVPDLPLVSVPVTVELQPPSPFAQVLGDQLAMSLLAPVPQFLTPAGTAKSATPQTGSLTVTNFGVDNDQLTQLAGTLPLPDGTPLSFDAPVQTDGVQSTGTRDVMHLALSPLSLDVLGARLEASGAEVTATFEHAAGSVFSGVESALSAIVRTAGQVALAFGSAVRAVGAVAPALYLPSWLSQSLEALTPPTASTILLSHFQLGPLNLSYPGLSLSVSSFVVDAFADTGPGKPLGNLFATVGSRGGNLGGMGALMDDILSRRPSPTTPSAVTPAAAQPTEDMPTHPGTKSPAGTSSSGGAGGSQDSHPKSPFSDRILYPQPSRPVPPAGVLVASFPPDLGGGARPHDAPPPPKRAADDAENDDPLSDDDNPLPSVLPDIGLPDEGDQPGAQNGIAFKGPGGNGELSSEPEQQAHSSSQEILSMTVIPAGGLFARLLSILDDTTDGDTELCWLRPTCPTVVTGLAIPPQQGRHPWYRDPTVGDNCDNGSGATGERVCHKTTPISVDEGNHRYYWGSIPWAVSSPILGVFASSVVPALYVELGEDELDPRAIPRMVCPRKECNTTVKKFGAGTT
jgi:hypothetical protein